MNRFQIKIGPERIVLRDGLQPFMFQTAQGRLVVTAQMPVPPGTVFPGVWATMISDDRGNSWKPWAQGNIKGGSPFHEGCVAQLKDGTILLLQWSARGPEPGGYWIAKFWESRDNWETVQGPFEARMLLTEARDGFFDDDGHPVPEVFLHRSLIELPDGTLVASFGNRTFESRVHLNALPPKEIGPGHGNYLAFSHDQGSAWDLPVQITSEPSSCYTTIREIAPGKLLLVYDIGDAWQHVWKGWENIQRGIACRRIEVETAFP